MSICKEIQQKVSQAFNMRTIERVEILGLNSWKFIMVDGGTVTIDTEHLIPGIYGPVIVEPQISKEKC